jgi:hypothetical protein
MSTGLFDFVTGSVKINRRTSEMYSHRFMFCGIRDVLGQVFALCVHRDRFFS